MTQLNRREFLKKAAVMGSATLAGMYLSSCSKNGAQLEEDWHLNPAFQITATQGNAIELYCYDGKGHKIAHEFSGLEADLLLAIQQKQSLTDNLPRLAEKNNCSEKQCRKQISNLLSEQEKAKIIYSGKEMLVFKREING
jgi:anaerobic selenocysteine-containing dehydrogenase